MSSFHRGIAPLADGLVCLILAINLTQSFGLHPSNNARPKIGTLPLDHRIWMDIKKEAISGLSIAQTPEADSVEFGSSHPENMLKYAELISDPSLTSEQKLEVVSSLYELLTCMWGPETAGKPSSL